MNSRLIISLVAACLSGSVLAQNRVLELDGKDSYVELPANIFNKLEGATVEGWIKWESFTGWSRFFEFGRKRDFMSIYIEETKPDLRSEIWRGGQVAASIISPGLLHRGEWHHVAMVTGPGGMQLFFNGVLVGQDPFSGSFNSIGNNDTNYLGRGVVQNLPDMDLHGQMDEVRVWKGERTEVQIRENLFKNLTGKEPGLVGLWHFNDGTANDSSTNAHHGKLMGNAKIVEARRPTAPELTSPTLLYGTVTDANGTVLPNARIVLEQSSSIAAETTSNAAGAFRLFVYPNAEPYEFSAVSGDWGEAHRFESADG